MKEKILLIEPTIQPVGVDILKEHFDIVMAPNGEENTLIHYITENHCVAVATRVERITHKVIEACPSLRVIAQHGVGLDNIDVQAATKFGVKVLNVPDGNFISVAEHVMMSVLALSRDLVNADKAVREDNWRFRETNIPHEVAEKVLLIVGLGRIGRNVARKAQAFDMKVMAFDPFVTAEQMAETDVEKAETLDDGLKKADFVTIQLHLTDATRGMMSTRQFEIMKPTASLINLSRGPVVDQAALCKALETREIASAALDVLEHEPPAADDPILKLPNVILTPHFGGDTIEAKRRCSRKLAETLVEAVSGGAPYNWANRKAMENA